MNVTEVNVLETCGQSGFLWAESVYVGGICVSGWSLVGSYLVEQRRLAQLDDGDLIGEVHGVLGSPQVVHAAILDIH